MNTNITTTNNTNTTVEPKFFYIKEWFWSKNQYEDYGAYCEHKAFVVKETEKAYKAIVFCQNNSFNCWVPKSCTLATLAEMSQEAEAAEQRKAECEAKRQERWEAACKAYNDLIAYAKAHGVRGVREGLRRETIEQKIINAGIVLPA